MPYAANTPSGGGGGGGSSSSTSNNATQVHYTITPWRHPSDLVRVRNSLYTPTTPDEQAHAIAQVAAWKLRGNVPHAVESTALLFDAMLFHARSSSSSSSSSSSVPSFSSSSVTPASVADGGGNGNGSSSGSSGSKAVDSIPRLGAPSATSFALRAAYTTALSRFVTGFADLGRHKSGIGQSMFDVARTIALPPHFVELRHEVAHEEMPGLARLVRSAREAVNWLWGVYWARLGEAGDAASSSLGPASHSKAQVTSPNHSGVNRSDMGTEEVRTKSRVVLKEYKTQKVAKLKAGKGKKGGKEQSDAVCGQLVSMCSGEDSREKWEEVAGVLIDEGLIIPSLKQRGPLIDTALQGAYVLWDDLLLQLAKKSDVFIDVFLEWAIAHNAAFKTTDSDQDASDPAKSAVSLWVIHILYSDEWQEGRRHSGTEWESTAARECSLYANDEWSQKLSREMASKSDGRGGRRSPKPAREVSAEAVMGDPMPSRGGWRKAAGPWKALAIGLVQD